MKKQSLNIILIFIALLGLNQADAQEYTRKAYNAIQNDQKDEAKAYIDSAVADSEETKSAQTWRFRGFIYKKLEDEKNPDLEIRKEALKSFEKSNELDDKGQYKEKNNSAISALVDRYYNQSAVNLKRRSFNSAQELFKTFKKKYYRFIDSSKSFRKENITFYNAYASYYSKDMNLQNKSKITPRLDTLINLYKKVLKYDSLNYNSNYNIAIIYYNIGVELVYALNPELKLEKLVRASKNCVNYFKKSLPYMKKAHELKPKRKETIEGLFGIHTNLSNEKKALHFKELKNQ